MRVLLDTNVLLRLAQPSHPQHGASDRWTTAARARGDILCIVPQIAYEYWVVATRPPAVAGLGFSTARAASDLQKVLRVFHLLRDERAVFGEWQSLVERHSVSGKPAHDARIVAAMLRHRLTHLVTMNTADFKRYPGITLIDPTRIE